MVDKPINWAFAKDGVYAHSRLVWIMIMIIIIMALWVVNLVGVVRDYNQRKVETIGMFQLHELENKGKEIQTLFNSIYQHTRTITLIPAIRDITGKNRTGLDDDIVAKGRLSAEMDATLRQLYQSLSNDISLSEIYYILDGFNPDQGEIPFFMYDGEIVGINPLLPGDELGNVDIPEEDESSEYAYYTEQLQKFKDMAPIWNYSGRISDIPAIASPLLRTCDNSQYTSITQGDIHNAKGVLYSLPVYGTQNSRLRGIISTVIRANVLEALLIGVPRLLITSEDYMAAEEESWSYPEEPSWFRLENSHYQIEIHDRRNIELEKSSEVWVHQEGGKIRTLSLDIVSDGIWTLSHYLPHKKISELTAELDKQLQREVLIRFGLLLLMFIIFWRANRDQQRHQQELIQFSHYDNLTSLPNRRLLFKRLEQSISRAKRRKGHIGVMLVDIDDFGAINDTLGHKAGDVVLIAISERLRSLIRLSDELTVIKYEQEEPTIARLGGDDFALIFDEIENPEDGVIIGERILLGFQEPINIGEQRAEISLCGGMAIYPDDAEEADDLIANADYALRNAISTGTGRFQMFNNKMRKEAARHNRLIRDLPNVVRHGLFQIYYQPKQSLDNDKIISFEALLRWTHEEFGFVSPVEFIPLLEQNGLIVAAGEWVLMNACRQLKIWHNQGRIELMMSINVSPRQLLLSNMEVTLDRVLAETGINPDKIILELTESTLMDNLDEGCRLLDALKKRGVHLAIDDFGTGYSSLTYIQGLPLDYLKLDKSMIDAIDNRRGAHVIKTTIELAHGLGLKVIAEGVESEHQKSILTDMGCDYIQGYLLTAPQPVERLTPWLN